MQLSAQQIRFFETFGFLSFPGLFADEIEAITDAFERVWSHHIGGQYGRPHDDQRRSLLVPFIDRDEYLSALIDDARIEGIAASLLGDDFNYTTSDGNFYVGDTGWHSDRGLEHLIPSLKMAFYLDPMGAESGCLRVIPGSHWAGDVYARSLEKAAPHPTVNHTEELWGVAGPEVPAIAIETKPGDLCLFNHATKHASFGGDTRRRMFTINMQQRYAEEHRDAMLEEIGSQAEFLETRAYGETMIRTAGPRRMRHLEQRLANDGHLAALVEKARAEMAGPHRP